MNSNSFGSELKRLRDMKNLTIRELAKRAGTSHPYLSQIENGKRNPPKPEMIQKLSKALEVDYLDLMVLAGHIGKEEAEYRKQILESTKYTRKRLDEFLDYTNSEIARMERDFYYILENEKEAVYYKEKPLDFTTREKVKIMLKTLLED
jgi:HTH-type transcriptional regulator, competence development regulator